MEHSIVVLIHLVGAILFVGAIAFEVFILEHIKRFVSLETFQKVEFYLFRRIKRVYWAGVLPLYMTGFYMYNEQIEAFGGFDALIATTFGKILTLKLVLALGLLVIFATAPFAFMKKQKNPLKHFFVITGDWQDFRIDRFEVIHYAALTLGLSIVVLAKIMFVV